MHAVFYLKQLLLSKIYMLLFLLLSCLSFEVEISAQYSKLGCKIRYITHVVHQVVSDTAVKTRHVSLYVRDSTVGFSINDISRTFCSEPLPCDTCVRVGTNYCTFQSS